MKKNFTKSAFILVIIFFAGINHTFGQMASGMPFGFSVVTPSGALPVYAAANKWACTPLGADNSTIILAPAGFNFSFAAVPYQDMLVSSNGWLSLLPSSTLSAPTVTAVTTGTSGKDSILVASTAGLSVGMYVAATGILNGQGYAQVMNIAGSTVYLNVNNTAAVTGNASFISLIPAANFFNALPNNNLGASATTYPMISPLWDDFNAVGFSYNFTAPVYTVQWTVKWDKSNAGGAPWAISAVQLNTTTNGISFLYPASAYAITGAPSASIGIAGICSGDFYSITPSTTTATIDSVTENAAITGVGRPLNVQYNFNPYNPYDNCSGNWPAFPAAAASIPTISAAATYQTYSNLNAITSGSAMTNGGELRDVWFRYIKPAGTNNITFTTQPTGGCFAAAGTNMEVWTACGGTLLAGSTTGSTYPAFGEITLNRPCIAETLYVRVAVDGDVNGKFQLGVHSTAAPLGGTGGATCGAPRFICSIPYNQTVLSTAGMGNEYDSTTAVCHTVAANGEDMVFSYTPTASGCIHIEVDGPAGNDPAVFIYNNCPDSSAGSPTYCLGSAEDPTAGIAIINSTTLTAGQTYYIVVDSRTGNMNFDIHVTSAGGGPPYDDYCTTPLNLGTIASGTACAFQTLSTECSTPTPAGVVPIPSCIPNSVPRAFIDGVTGDVWMSFTAGFSGALLITTQQSATNPTANAAMAIYTRTGACPSPTYTAVACDYNSGVNGMPVLSLNVTSGTVYYIRVWSENPESQGQFDLCFQSSCSPPNDLPCAAVYLTLGSTASGYNVCATGGAPEPLNAAQCTAGGTINTVWYKVLVPASGQVRIRTHPLTLTDTQIQAYTFSSNLCSNSASGTSKGCNDDGVACDAGFHAFSDLTCTGLTPNDTLWIAVDGAGSLTGSFEITAIDATSPSGLPPVAQQDCAAAQSVCNSSSIIVADPGFRNNGNICDLPSGAGTCWFNGERNSVWYTFSVNPGTIAFDVLTASSTDIDYLLWDVTGLANPCASIAAASIAPASCNYAAANSGTGMTTAAGPPYGYSPAITIGGTRTYILLLNCYNSAINAGFTLNWNTTPIAAAGSNAIWSGLTDTLFSTSTNWGDCGGTPACGVDALVNSTANGRQPYVYGAQAVNNITISAGASLHIQPGATLTVCGNFTNFGNLICGAGSTIQFIGSATQTVTGNLTGLNAFPNLTVQKGGGSVILAANIDVGGNFTTSTAATSVFNINGKYMKVARDFNNFAGVTTFPVAGIAGSTVEFNGSVNQYFTNNSGSLRLNRVKINKPSGKLYLTGANSIMNIDTALVLTSGNIVTRSLAALEVNLTLNQAISISGYSQNSFIDGKLRRAVYETCCFTPPTYPYSMDYPVGDSAVGGAANGYELMNITFPSGGASATGIPDLLAYFSQWPGGPPGAPALGPNASECINNTYDALPIFDQGYWTVQKSSATNTGLYHLTLHNTGYANNTGSGWTVAKADIAANPSLPASWGLFGSCFALSTATTTSRLNLNSVASAATSFNHLYATVQSQLPLPIELLSFTAEPSGEDVLCKWITASETNNDYFEVERSTDGEEFNDIGRVKGFGEGTTTTSRSYKFTDHDKCDDVRYYRLRQVDIDGQFKYSQTVAVNCKNTSNNITVYPNPASSVITYQFFQGVQEEVHVRILDMTGRVIKDESLISQKGFNTSTMSIDELAKGLYYLELRSTASSSDMTPRQVQFMKN